MWYVSHLYSFHLLDIIIVHFVWNSYVLLFSSVSGYSVLLRFIYTLIIVSQFKYSILPVFIFIFISLGVNTSL